MWNDFRLIFENCVYWSDGCVQCTYYIIHMHNAHTVNQDMTNAFRSYVRFEILLCRMQGLFSNFCRWLLCYQKIPVWTPSKIGEPHPGRDHKNIPIPVAWLQRYFLRNFHNSMTRNFRRYIRGDLSDTFTKLDNIKKHLTGLGFEITFCRKYVFTFDFS